MSADRVARGDVERWLSKVPATGPYNIMLSETGETMDLRALFRALLAAWDVIEDVQDSCSAEGICCGWEGRDEDASVELWHAPDCKLAAVLAQSRGTARTALGGGVGEVEEE